jgi:hypothetical protein
MPGVTEKEARGRKAFCMDNPMLRSAGWNMAVLLSGIVLI